MTTSPRTRRRAFSLIELLVVMGIIVVLLGILIPVVNNVRRAAYAANTQNRISRISMAIDNYYTEFKAYPGPLANNQAAQSPNAADRASIRAGTTTEFLVVTPQDKVTMSENLVLGLCGGLRYTRQSANTGTFDFVKDLVGKGPRNLSTLEGKPQFAKQYEPFFDVKPGDLYVNQNPGPDLGTGKYIDSAGAAADTEVPEFVDAFPNAMPILYLRANVGAPGVVYESGLTTTPVVEQYDVKQIMAYTDTLIGTGRPSSLRGKYTTAGDFDNHPHGLRSPVTKNTSMDNPAPTGFVYTYPYNAFAYLRDPSAQFDPTLLTTATGAPRRKDSYILISPGPDRTYGTEDDITNFGSVNGK